MRVLVACEESQTVTKAFRAAGHEAYSCDVLPCSGGRPDWHVQTDVETQLYKGWDLMIAHPPCTYLCNSGVRWLHEPTPTLRLDKTRWDNLDSGAEFFRTLLNSGIPKIAVENPIPHKYAVKRIGAKYDQLIQPWMFGHKETKVTCLWLKGLPFLEPTTNLKEETKALPKKQRHRIRHASPGPKRSQLRSKTFSGIAEAMAQQWGQLQ